jgi:hypothetical protein
VSTFSKIFEELTYTPVDVTDETTGFTDFFSTPLGETSLATVETDQTDVTEGVTYKQSVEPEVKPVRKPSPCGCL